MIKEIKEKFTLLEWGMILSVIGFTIYFSIINTTNTLLYLILDGIVAISGIICVVLCAKGKKTQYFFGLLNIVGYAIISWINNYYGEVMLNLFYYLPSQFIGYYLWNKNLNKDTNNVKGKKLTLKQTIIFLIILVVCIFGYKYLLYLLGGSSPLLDSASTCISIVANLLMLLRYREQWLLWIIIDVITVIMWMTVKDYVMVTMWTVYLINAVNGYYQWTKMSKEG